MTFNIERCQKRLQPYIYRTPLVQSEILSEMTNKNVYLKLESFQKTGAFKYRGSLNYLLTLPPEEAKYGVMTASSGNHGLGMSLGARLLGYGCAVVMPSHAPIVKQERARNYGAEVILYGESYDDAANYAQCLAQERGWAYVPSFNHPAIIEGQGTILWEIKEQLPSTQLIITPIGGGGIVAGLLQANEQLGTGYHIWGVEPEGAACMHASLRAGRQVTLDKLETYADGVAVRTPGDITFAVVQYYRPELFTVSEDHIKEAQMLLLTKAKVVAEPAAAVAIAGLLNRELPKEIENIVCVITGANVDEKGLRHLLNTIG